MIIKRICFLLAGILMNAFAIGQVNDARLWLSAGVEKKITRKWYSDTKASIRLNENYGQLGSYYWDVGAGYKLFKRFKVEVHYRYSGKIDNQGYYHKRSRFYIDVLYKIKTSTPIVITIKERFQKQYTDMFTSESGFNPANTLRTALFVSYQYKRAEPYIGSELYYLIDNSIQQFNRIRYMVGSEYSFDKRNKLEVFYMIQQELNSQNPTRAFILSVGYKYIL